MPAFVSFVIVSWNGKHLLQDCLPSVKSQTFSDHEIFVVDNGSSDGTVEWLAREHPDVRVIALPSNLGFAEPNNIAFGKSNGRYVATINNDLTLHPEWLATLCSALEGNPKCFAAQGKILRSDEPEKIDTCGLGIRPCGAARNLAHNRNASSITSARSIFTVSAGAALYRLETLRELNYFDSQYFAYYEDLDLGWRARLKGWEAVLAPEAVAYHKVHGTSSTVDGDFLWFLSERNRLRTFVKSMPWGALFRHPFGILLDELRYIDMIRKRASWSTLLRARFAVLKELLRLLRMRPAELKQFGASQWREWLSLSAE